MALGRLPSYRERCSKKIEASMTVSIPSHAEYVIVGGGIIGLSLAYHLIKQGKRDVVLLERRQLTCGTTWHAAGLVTQLRATENMARLAQYTAKLFGSLEQETGQSTGFRQCGSITVATSPARLTELQRGASMASAFGLTVEMLDPREAQRRVPELALQDVLGAAWIDTDGKTNPIDTARAFAAGAKKGGARLFEGVTVTGIEKKADRVEVIRTDHGDIRCEKVAFCGGMWSHQLGLLAGVTVPLHAAEHFYIVTDAISGLRTDFPTVRDLDARFYAKEDAGRLLVGAFEAQGKPWGMQGIPADFCFDQLPNDEEHFAPILEAAVERLPILSTAGLQLFFNGPESFTPDNRFLLGPAPEVAGLYLACGFNSCGIESSGGAGKVLADWMINEAPPADYWDIDSRRVMPFQRNRRYLHDRTGEALGLLYGLNLPFYSPQSSRGVRRSPLHEQLARRGAMFGEAAGWERPLWFNRDTETQLPWFGFERAAWFQASAREHTATREAVTLFDQTSFAHFIVQGRDALSLLQRVSCNDIDVPVGRIIYTPWLNERGGMESDLTIARLKEQEFLIVTAGAQRTRDLLWLRQHIRADEWVSVTDMCSAYATLSVMGPRSRTLLQKISNTNFDNEHFPFGTWQEIEIGYGLALAFRMTFVGELGWELHIPSEFAAGITEQLFAAGEELGLLPAGYVALDSLRMESAYRDWGHDISDEDSPLEAGLGFTVAWNKSVPFLGQKVLRAQRGKPPAKRLVQFALQDSQPLLFGTEPVIYNGKIVSYLKSGCYGHTLLRSIGMGYLHSIPDLTQEWLNQQSFEIEVAGQRFPATASLRAFYDPKRTRVIG
jgi:glycine cleavage system aminomethyltransferase T/glycine/D-amino acid oxidase-like deaminating enzyme